MVYDNARYFELLGQMRGAASAYLVNYDPEWAGVARDRVESVKDASRQHHLRLYCLADAFQEVRSQLRRIEDVVLQSELEVLSELDRALNRETGHESVDLFYMVTRFMELTSFFENVFALEFDHRLERISDRYYLDMTVLISLLVMLIGVKIGLYT
ncbi:MAG: hypothetical protein GYB21_20870 [Oceanospirillales bacterium]|nr:hypothetical protein [Oceanospirillales bacterium]